MEPWLEIIDEMNGWFSPHLGIKFKLIEETLILYCPDKQMFRDYDYIKVEQQLEAAESWATVRRNVRNV